MIKYVLSFFRDFHRNVPLSIKEKKMIGTTEILVISAVVVLLFGASALPKFARNIGKARLEFEQGMKEAREMKNQAENTPEA